MINPISKIPNETWKKRQGVLELKSLSAPLPLDYSLEMGIVLAIIPPSGSSVNLLCPVKTLYSAYAYEYCFKLKNVHIHIFPFKYIVRHSLASKMITAAFFLSAVAYLATSARWNLAKKQVKSWAYLVRWPKRYSSVYAIPILVYFIY